MQRNCAKASELSSSCKKDSSYSRSSRSTTKTVVQWCAKWHRLTTYIFAAWVKTLSQPCLPWKTSSRMKSKFRRLCANSPSNSWISWQAWWLANSKLKKLGRTAWWSWSTWPIAPWIQVFTSLMFCKLCQRCSSTSMSTRLMLRGFSHIYSVIVVRKGVITCKRADSCRELHLT